MVGAGGGGADLQPPSDMKSAPASAASSAAKKPPSRRQWPGTVSVSAVNSRLLMVSLTASGARMSAVFREPLARLFCGADERPGALFKFRMMVRLVGTLARPVTRSKVGPAHRSIHPPDGSHRRETARCFDARVVRATMQTTLRKLAVTVVTVIDLAVASAFLHTRSLRCQSCYGFVTHRRYRHHRRRATSRSACPRCRNVARIVE